MRALGRVLLPLSLGGLFAAGPTGPAIASWPHDPAGGNLPLCTAANRQTYPAIVSDGAGGTILVWQDTRDGPRSDIYAQRVDARGVPQWTANGVRLCDAQSYQYGAAIASDGAGGAIVVWHDGRSNSSYDIYGQRISAAGAPQWAANGVALCTAPGDQVFPRIVADGAGGAIVSWQDDRGSAWSIYAQRVDPGGVVQWVAGGVRLSTAAGHQALPAMTADGAGGAIVAWQDMRSGTSYDIYAQRIDGAGALQWSSGAALCSAANDQGSPAIVADGTGGAIVVWEDFRSGTQFDVGAQRVNAAGVPQWTVDGVTLCAAPNDQQGPAIASDDAGGAIVTWTDHRNGVDADVYAQRVNAAGAPQWVLDGVPLSAASGDQDSVVVVSDGAGGAIAVWQDRRSGTHDDIYGQQVSGTGTPQWTIDGVALSAASSEQSHPAIALDPEGGVIAVWQDAGAGSGDDVQGQRVGTFGVLGNPEPSIASIVDAPGDQGGHVVLTWTASYLDSLSDPRLDSYDVDRRSPGGGAWVHLGSVPAGHPLTPYGFVAATAADSTAAGNARTAFRVVGRNSSGSLLWPSAPDSGYSVDNLAPAAPASFSGTNSVGVTHLHWEPNQEADLAGYRLYRGTAADFIPSPGTLLVAKPDTGYTDVGPIGSYYKLSAVDTHGNESAYSLLTPDATAGAPGDVELALTSANPARGGVSLQYGLPRPGNARLAIYDLAGREVRVLARGPADQGVYSQRWDGRNQSGRGVEAGMYLVRLEASGRDLVRRVVLFP